VSFSPADNIIIWLIFSINHGWCSQLKKEFPLNIIGIPDANLFSNDVTHRLFQAYMCLDIFIVRLLVIVAARWELKLHNLQDFPDFTSFHLLK
jgi:hypothetical protein